MFLCCSTAVFTFNGLQVVKMSSLPEVALTINGLRGFILGMKLPNGRTVGPPIKPTTGWTPWGGSSFIIAGADRCQCN